MTPSHAESPDFQMLVEIQKLTDLKLDVQTADDSLRFFLFGFDTFIRPCG